MEPTLICCFCSQLSGRESWTLIHPPLAPSRCYVSFDGKECRINVSISAEPGIETGTCGLTQCAGRSFIYGTRWWNILITLQLIIYIVIISMLHYYVPYMKDLPVLEPCHAADLFCKNLFSFLSSACFERLHHTCSNFLCEVVDCLGLGYKEKLGVLM